MANHAGRKLKHPYCLDKFWISPDNHFWITSGRSYTPASIAHFQTIVDEAQANEDRWHKPNSRLHWKR